MITTIRRIEFDAAHRVYGHEGKCQHLHGHRYAAEVTVRAEHLDEVGRVIDFSVVKELVGGWVDRHWDHNILLNPDDPLAPILTARSDNRDPFFMPEGNPTAECMAVYLWTIAQSLLSSNGLRVTRVRIYETPNCFADYSPDPAH